MFILCLYVDTVHIVMFNYPIDLVRKIASVVETANYRVRNATKCFLKRAGGKNNGGTNLTCIHYLTDLNALALIPRLP